MNIKLVYGTGFQSADVPEKNILKILEPNAIQRPDNADSDGDSMPAGDSFTDSRA